MATIRDSKYWQRLIQRYPRSPSIALCRVPELELFSRVQLQHPVLDHCGGDGFISGLAFDGKTLDACVDLDEARLDAARRSGRYREVKRGDVGVKLPFDDGQFATVLNNSGIEHVPNLQTALNEIFRVLRPGGRAILNVLNRRYFDNWPHDQASMLAYREWQPFFHALDESEWSAELSQAGFAQISFVDYFPVAEGRILADLDYRFSRMYLKHRASLSTVMEALGTRGQLERRWTQRLGNLQWDARPGMGVGFTITATRADSN